MKKFILPLIALLFLAACSDDVQFNNPSIQGRIDHAAYFHTFEVSAGQNADGSLVMLGKQGSRQLELTLSSMQANTEYILGGDSGNQAIFKTIDDQVFKTQPDGEGYVYISSTSENALTGYFGFTAYTHELLPDTLHFSEGTFFEIPLTSPGDWGGQPEPGDPEPMSCDDAVEASGQASLAYTQAVQSGTPEEIMTACIDYRAALETQIEICGDQNGFVQQQIDNLDCGDENDEDQNGE